ncbi:UNVERIFIED_CONTAM: hypothetical protein Scaly_0763000 [Sesamum calycinum]|uniref:Uncharacterized protein n=1 Tax=Sesamum calycinum TaxID=2727403 RepID=A0AAW2R954_9LAMI
MGNRIDELEQSINDLRTEMGQEGSASPSAPLKTREEPSRLKIVNEMSILQIYIRATLRAAICGGYSPSSDLQLVCSYTDMVCFDVLLTCHCSCDLPSNTISLDDGYSSDSEYITDSGITYLVLGLISMCWLRFNECLSVCHV